MDYASVESARQPGRKGRIFLSVGLLATVIAAVGFWPSYFGPLLAGTVEKPPIIHVHAAVFVGWLAIFVAQAALAATGRTRAHMRFGRFGMGYGVLLVVVGTLTGFSLFGVNVEAGDFDRARRGLFSAVVDMLVFAPLLAAAWAYRRKPEIHKRLIVVATTYLLIAAVFRMAFLGGRPPPLPQYLLVWLSPIYIAMAHDYLKRRIVHPVYLLGIAVLTIMRFRAPLRDTEAWIGFCRWLAGFYA